MWYGSTGSFKLYISIYSCDGLAVSVVVTGGLFPMVYLYDTRGLGSGDGPYQQVTTEPGSIDHH